ncbi:hypothetical protein [Streptomyces botrytidirepellens]|uniref:hypothetical protein n=1 Tax=Streptomyces botrytidirepellens TaxID=2486417 RepID=UPI0011CD4302|nr:hypothetical protein [Streptomyces botrytidirepellens]
MATKKDPGGYGPEELASAAAGLRRLANADTPPLTAPEDRMERVRHRVVRARRRRTAVVAAPMVVALIAGAVSLATGLRDGRSADPGTTPATTPTPDRTAPPRKVLKLPDVAGGMDLRVSVPDGWRVQKPHRVDDADGADRADGTDGPASETYVLAGPAAHEASSTAATGTPESTPPATPESTASATVPPSTGDRACGDALKEARYGPELCLPVTRLAKNSALVLWRRESYDRPERKLPVQRSLPTPVCRELGGTAFLSLRQPLPDRPDSTVAAYACLASADSTLIEHVKGALSSARFS